MWRGKSSRKLLLASLGTCLLAVAQTHGFQTAQVGPPALTGRWIIQFTVGSQQHRLQFDAAASGEGTFLALDASPASTPTATPAAWMFNGQSPAIFYFLISGHAEFPTSVGGVQKGRLDLSASSDPALPVNSLRGWGRFDVSDPSDPRGSEPPSFEFTATRADGMTVELISPGPGERVRRGREVTVEWRVQSTQAVVAQVVLLSLDGGESYVVIVPGLGGDIRSLKWAVPESLPRTKRALLKVVVTGLDRTVAEGLSTQTFRIK